MIKAYALLFIVLILFSNIVFSSSYEAWETHNKEVIEACLKSSGLREVKAIGEIIGFDDNIGYEALVVSGHYPQPHMKNAKSVVLCLFNRETRAATVSEASGLYKVESIINGVDLSVVTLMEISIIIFVSGALTYLFIRRGDRAPKTRDLEENLTQSDSTVVEAANYTKLFSTQKRGCEMGKGLGVAALVLGLLGIFVPIVTIYVIWLSLILAAIAGLLGDKTFPIAAALANLVNILFMSPVTLITLTGEHLDKGPTPLMTTTTILFIAPIVTMILGALKGRSR